MNIKSRIERTQKNNILRSLREQIRKQLECIAKENIYGSETNFYEKDWSDLKRITKERDERVKKLMNDYETLKRFNNFSLTYEDLMEVELQCLNYDFTEVLC